MKRLLGTLAISVLAGTGLVAATTSAQASRPGDAARFDTWVGYDVGRFVTAVEAADLNGDGRTDAAWVRDDFFENSLTVTLNLGDGTLDATRTYPTAEQSTDVAAADLDGDGDVDLAVSAEGNGLDNDVVDLLLNNGSGGFTHTTTTGGSGPAHIAAGDVDADGDIDLVLANPSDPLPDSEEPRGTVTVLRNQGDATFAEETTVVGPNVHDIVIRDLTGDDSVDLGAALLNQETNRYELHVLEQRPNGTFAPDATPQPFDVSTNGGIGWPALAAGDLDADEDVDLVMAGAATFENAVLTNDGAGSFDVATYPATTVAVQLADVDADDDLDITGVGGGGGIRGVGSIQRNNGDGTFADPETFVTGSNPLGIDIGNLNGDGRPDLLVAARDIGAGVTHRQLTGGTYAGPDGGQQFAPSVGVATGDVDDDGDPDVAAALDGFDGNTIRVLGNDGTGGLNTVDTVPSGSDPRSLTVADLDEDGDADLSWLAGRVQFQVVTTALSNGDGTFASPSTRTVSTCSNHLNVADVDDDGDLDQIVGNDDFCSTSADVDQVSVSLNNGSAGFGTERLVRMTEFTADTAVADIDDDGAADLVGGSALATNDDIAVALGNGNGTFAAPVFTTTGASHREIVVRDLDGDGDDDLASNAFEDGTAVLLGNGTATFPSVDFLAGEGIIGYRNAVGLAVGDIDGDAILDIVVANESGSDVGVHSGLGDGAFEPRQVRYGMRPRVTDVAVADLDGDSVLDIVSPAQLPGGAGFARAGARRALAAAPVSAAQAAAVDPAGLTLLLGSMPRCTVVGSAGDDVLVGTRRTDVICGGDGDDRLRGFGGGDVLRGGRGNDVLDGNEGFDLVHAGGGDDSLHGGRGADRLTGGSGGDRVQGNLGSDVVDLMDQRRRNDRGNGGAGADHCRSDRRDVLEGCL